MVDCGGAAVAGGANFGCWMLDVGCWMLDSFRIQNCSFKIRVSGADEDGGVPKWDGGLKTILNFG
jgi:hypothetical protein